jgi:hypothetical protein
MMTILGTLFGILARVLGILGPSVLKPALEHLQAKEVQHTTRSGMVVDLMKSAFQAEVDRGNQQSRERIALWGDFWYKALVMLIIGPPALYAAAVFADSIFRFEFDIDAAPARFEELGFDIMKAFIYGGSFAGGVIGAAKMIFRR